MADPTVSLNSALIGAGLNTTNPTDTDVEFANSIARNQQTQQMQEALIAQAQERAKQAQITTTGEETAQAAGFIPQLADTMTPQEAGNYLHIVKQAKGLSVTDDQIDAWVANLPPVVKSEEVEAFMSRFARETVRPGQKVELTTDQEWPIPNGKSAADIGLQDEHDANGKSVDDTTISDGTFTGHVPNDGMYQTFIDNQGVIVRYSPGGSEPVDQSIKLGEKDSQFWTNQWKTRIANKINPYLASSRTAVGVGVQSYIRCLRALQTLGRAPVTRQDAVNVVQEIGAIYKGGSPDQSSILQTSYDTVYGDFQSMLQKYGGKPLDNLPEDIRLHMVSRVQDLENESKQVITDSLSAAQAANQDVIDHFPLQWKNLVAQIDKAMTDPNNPASSAGSPSNTPTAPGTSGVPKYTVVGQ